MTKRVATAVFAVLLISLTVIPATGVCCVAKSAGMAAMHASMPCCANHCTIRTDSSSRDHDVATVSTTSQSAANAVTAVLADAFVPGFPVAIDVPNADRSDELSPPPTFLLDRDFRI